MILFFLSKFKTLKKWQSDFLGTFRIYLRFEGILLILNCLTRFVVLLSFKHLLMILSLLFQCAFVIGYALAHLINFWLKCTLLHLIIHFFWWSDLFGFWHIICSQELYYFFTYIVNLWFKG